MARVAQALILGVFGAILGAELAALEGAWMALKENLPTRSFDPALRAVMLTNALLFCGLGGLLGLFLPGRWTPKLCALALGGSIWILSYHLGILGTIIGAIVVAAWCLWFLRMGPRGRLVALVADVAVILAIWATPLESEKFGFFAEWLGAEAPIALGEPLSDQELAALPNGRLPNIVFLTIDTLRADHLGSYGYAPPAGAPPQSPVLDQIAAEGTRFEAAYAQAPWTRPSVASLFTGLYPASHDVITQYQRMGADLPTISTMLKSRGYRTACFSANPQVSPAFGFHRGYDQFWNSYSSLAETTAVWALRHKVAAIAFDLVPGLLGRVREAQAGVPGTDAASVNQAISTWLDREDAAELKEQPLFLYVQYLDPHDPYHAPDTPADVEHLDESFLHAPQSLPPHPLKGSTLPPVDDATLAALKAAYDREIRFVDARLGEMLEDLRARGLYQEGDYLIVTSDHGEEFYDHDQWLHGRSLYEEMVRIPLLIHGPSVPVGKVIEAPVELTDMVETLAGMTGRESGFPTHGMDLFPLMVGRDSGSNELAYSHRPNEAHPIYMLRAGSHKLLQFGNAIEGGEEPLRLAFDLSTDPDELSPLPEAGGQEWERLHELLTQFMDGEAEYMRSGSSTVNLTGSVKEGLGALGYIDGETPPPPLGD